jgi:hypothetical protein
MKIRPCCFLIISPHGIGSLNLRASSLSTFREGAAINVSSGETGKNFSAQELIRLEKKIQFMFKSSMNNAQKQSLYVCQNKTL